MRLGLGLGSRLIFQGDFCSFFCLPGSWEGSRNSLWQKNCEIRFLTCQQPSHNTQARLIFMLGPMSCHQGWNLSLRLCSVFFSSGKRELGTTPVDSWIIQDLGKELLFQTGRKRAPSTSVSTISGGLLQDIDAWLLVRSSRLSLLPQVLCAFLPVSFLPVTPSYCPEMSLLRQWITGCSPPESR